MELIANYPIIPGITFLLILGFFGYQIRIMMKERQRAKTPKLPNMQVPGKVQPEKKVVIPKIQVPVAKNVTEIKKKYNPIVQFLSVLVLLLVVVSTIGVFYVYKNQSVPFVPRASGPEPTSPLLSQSPGSPDTPQFGVLSPTIAAPTSNPTGVNTLVPTATPVLIASNATLAPTKPAATPTTALLTPTKVPTATVVPTGVTPSKAAANTPVPTKGITLPVTIIPTKGPTFAPSGATSTPTPVLIAKNSLTVTPVVATPTEVSNGTLTVTPKPTQTGIPEAGFPLYLGVFVVMSLVFLAIGFVW